MRPAPSFRSWHVGETALSCVAQHVVAVFFGERWARYGYMGRMGLQGPRCVGNPMVTGRAPITASSGYLTLSRWARPHSSRPAGMLGGTKERAGQNG